MNQLALALALAPLTGGLAACTESEDATVAIELAVADVADDLETQIRFYCPGVDRAAGVPDYRGLTGTYVRLGFPAAEEPYRLTLTTLVEVPYTAGTFVGLRGTAAGMVAPYAGTFRALPDNPAIGAAFAFDLGADGRFDETAFVLGLRRSFGGTSITGLCLAGGAHPYLLARTYI